MRSVLMAFCLIISACSTPTKVQPVFTAEEFTQLKFLQGRWEGTGPDGANFYEQYAFESPTLMRSTRFKDSNFSEATDGSAVELVHGEITSTWNEFTWVASELSEGKACFSPVNAPSSFCWERVDEATLHVTQRWTGEDGKAQQYVVPMRRL